MIQAAYPNNLAWANEEGQLVFAFWKYLSSPEDPMVRERMAYQYRQQENAPHREHYSQDHPNKSTPSD
jgi:hypothetical protein